MGQTRTQGPRWEFDAGALRYAMLKAHVNDPGELSHASGVTRSCIKGLLDNTVQRPTAAQLCSLATTLGCDALDLMVEVSR